MSWDKQRPLLCVVTDRSRLPGKSDDLGRLLELIRKAGSACVDLVQIREPDLSDRALCDLVRRAVDGTRETHTRIIVNDRVDIALAAGAAGVHLKSDSMPAERVRDVAPPGWLVGRSVHGLDEASQVTASGALDYVVLGAVFETLSKPGGHPLGLDVLRHSIESIPVPVLAIGGITIHRVPAVAACGAAGLAAIGMFAEAADRRPEGFGILVERLRSLFERSRTVETIESRRHGS